ncbi:hypothetical protein ACEZ3G_04770 [Maribacter algicola]|uniref:Uncharacterized protein n=1 Tax=Meishania litoralis TaxID=3434685 RepID=A0ACC7LH16_9FLAO
MNRVSMFGPWGIKKSGLMAAHQMGDRILKLASGTFAIVSSQHDYYFIPTTERQYLI